MDDDSGILKKVEEEDEIESKPKKEVTIADGGEKAEKSSAHAAEPPKPKRKKSFIFRKFAELEKELTFDNIHQKVTNALNKDDESSGGGGGGGEGSKKKKKKKQYLSSAAATLFYVSATTGSAMSHLPQSLKQSSWFGVFLVLLYGLNTLYAGLCTGWSWAIMEERWPEYQGETRIPYQDMAYRAVGVWMKYVVAVCIDVTQLGTVAVYFLIISNSVEMVAANYISFCITMIVVTAVIFPFMWFGSFRDIRLVAVCDVLFSALYVLLVVVTLFLDKSSNVATPYTDPSYESVALAFAGFSFAYGGGAVYPSIMADMKDRSQYPHAVATACMFSIVIYCLLPILGYAAYGDNTPEDIVENFLKSDDIYNYGVAIQVTFILQLITTVIVALLPTVHAFENRLNCPTDFSIWRVLIRLVVLIFLLLVVMGIPYLNKFVEFVGATSMNLLTFVFPPVFYVCLVYRSKDSKRHVSKKEWVLLSEMVLLGILVCITSTYVSLKKYAASPPNRISCYFDMHSKSTNPVLKNIRRL